MTPDQIYEKANEAYRRAILDGISIIDTDTGEILSGNEAVAKWRVVVSIVKSSRGIEITAPGDTTPYAAGHHTTRTWRRAVAEASVPDTTSGSELKVGPPDMTADNWPNLTPEQEAMIDRFLASRKNRS